MPELLYLLLSLESITEDGSLWPLHRSSVRDETFSSTKQLFPQQQVPLVPPYGVSPALHLSQLPPHHLFKAPRTCSAFLSSRYFWRSFASVSYTPPRQLDFSSSPNSHCYDPFQSLLGRFVFSLCTFSYQLFSFLPPSQATQFGLAGGVWILKVLVARISLYLGFSTRYLISAISLWRNPGSMAVPPITTKFSANCFLVSMGH